jgi:hypothetical protein
MASTNQKSFLASHKNSTSPGSFGSGPIPASAPQYLLKKKLKSGGALP